MNGYSIDDMKKDLLNWDFTTAEIAAMTTGEILAAWITLPAII